MTKTRSFDSLVWSLRKGGGTSWWIAKVPALPGTEFLLSVSEKEYRLHSLSTDEDPIEWRVKIQTTFDVSGTNQPPAQIKGGRAATPELAMSAAKAWLTEFSEALLKATSTPMEVPSRRA